MRNQLLQSGGQPLPDATDIASALASVADGITRNAMPLTEAAAILAELSQQLSQLAQSSAAFGRR
jgi:hypothetical protein